MRGARGPVLLGIALVGLASAVPSKSAPPVLPFIRDDYPKALAAARARKLPIFVEAWAPW